MMNYEMDLNLHFNKDDKNVLCTASKATRLSAVKNAMANNYG